MNTIDLHVHSTASDGSFTPQEVVSLARKAGLRYFALTDHDTVSGIPEAIAEASLYDDIDVVPGIELSCYYDHREIHIVGLFVDYQDEGFISELYKLEQARENRNNQMVEKFVENGIMLTIEELKHGNPDSIITRAHFARVLVEKGICSNKKEAFDKYLGIGCPYYLPKPKVTPEHVLNLIKQAHGIAILAHPYSYRFERHQLLQLLDELIPLGLSGMECYYSTYDTGQIQDLRSIAHSKNLLVSGGSDFHGVIKPDISIGSGRNNLHIPESILTQIKEALDDRLSSIH